MTIQTKSVHQVISHGIVYFSRLKKKTCSLRVSLHQSFDLTPSKVRRVSSDRIYLSWSWRRPCKKTAGWCFLKSWKKQQRLINNKNDYYPLRLKKWLIWEEGCGKKGRVFQRVKCNDSEGSFSGRCAHFCQFRYLWSCLLLLIVLYYCRSGRFVRLLVIFFWSFVIFLAALVLLALVTNDRHLWIFVPFLLPVKKSLITAATHPSKFPFVFSR